MSRPQFCGPEAMQNQIRKARWCGGPAAQDVDKICATLRRESDLCDKKQASTTLHVAQAISKSKSLKHRGFGALSEIELRKICATAAREWLGSQNCKNWRSRGVFGGSKWFSHGRRNDFDRLQNTRQAQDWAWVAKTLADVVDLKRVWNDALGGQAQWFRDLACRCLRLRTLNLWKGCKCRAAEMLHSRGHFVWQLQGFVCLGSTFRGRPNTFEACTEISLKRIVFLRSSRWSTFCFRRKSRKNALFLNLSYIFEGSLAEKIVFEHFWRKSRRRCLARLRHKACWRSNKDCATHSKDHQQRTAAMHIEHYRECIVLRRKKSWILCLGLEITHKTKPHYNGIQTNIWIIST